MVAMPLSFVDRPGNGEVSVLWSENGTHAVVIMAGDADSRAQTNHLVVNGVPVRDETPYDGEVTHGYETGSFDGYAITVTVTDGTITIVGDVDALDPKLNFIEIGPTGSTADQDTIDRVREAALQATHDTAKPKAKTPPTVRRNIWGGGYVDDLTSYTVAKPRHAAVRSYVYSGSLYSAAAVTDAAGRVVTRYAYDAYGQQNVVTGASDLGRGFTGYRTDAETGMYYARARMYSGRLGRFVSKDPMSYVDGYSLYGAYFVPNRLDPTGKIGVSVTDKTTVVPGSSWQAFKVAHGIGDSRAMGATDKTFSVDVAGKADGCGCQFTIGPMKLDMTIYYPSGFSASVTANILAHEKGHVTLFRQLAYRYATTWTSPRTVAMTGTVNCADKAKQLQIALVAEFYKRVDESGEAFHWELIRAGAHNPFDTTVDEINKQLGEEAVDEADWTYNDWSDSWAQ